MPIFFFFIIPLDLPPRETHGEEYDGQSRIQLFLGSLAQLSSNHLSSAVQAAIINYHRLRGLYNNLFCMVLEAGKSRIKVLEDLMRVLFLVCRWASCILTERASCFISLLRTPLLS